LVAILVGAVSVALLFGYLVMLLWNWLMPAVFGAREVTYWQAAGLILLARLLVGTSTGGGGRSGRWRQREPRQDRDYWKHYDAWWNSEGKAAFEAHAERQKSAECSDDGRN
jgi:hypothetical protein